jgi:hypothetical protein
MNPLFSIELLLLAAALAVGLGAWLAWRSSAGCGRWRRLVIAALRALAVACLAVIALNPGRWRQRSEPARQRWTVLVDRSRSMAVADVDGRSRWQAAVALARQARHLSALPSVVDMATFADGLDATPATLDAAAPDGPASDILGALQATLDRAAARGAALNGVLLLSDGRQVGASGHADAAERAGARNVPVYTVALGGAVRTPDLELTAVRRHIVAFGGQPTPLLVDAANSGLGNVRPTIQVRAPDGRILASQAVELADGQRRRVRLEITAPLQAGYLPLTAELVGGPGDSRPDTDRAAIGLLTLNTRLRVLLIEGEPFWDSKFLVQLLRKLPVTDVTSVYRLASDRFFRVDSDLASAQEAAHAGFPDTDDELDTYDVVAIGRGAEYFLTAERIARLQRFVRDHGGCLLFTRGKPSRQPIAELEPLEPLTWDAPVEGAFRIAPTTAGEEAGLFGELLPAADDRLWQVLPPLRQMQPGRPAGAFVQVLAEAVDGGRRLPLVASRRLGKGLTVSVGGDGLWQWSFFPEVVEASDAYARFWSQLLQWAAMGGDFLPGQEYALQADAHVTDVGASVRLRVRGRAATPSGAPGVQVWRDGQPARTLALAPVPGASRLWDALWQPDAPGAYQLALHVAGSTTTNGAAAASVTVVVRPAAGENDALSADPAFLARLAAHSGGRAVASTDLAAVVAALDPKPTAGAHAETVWEPRWDRAMWLLLMTGCFGLEWFLRRRGGLS